MADYSAELENGLAQLIRHSKTTLNLCNTMRSDFENVLSSNSYWRDYHEDVLLLFENINSLERAALFLIENSDVIRRKNDASGGN